MGRWVAHHEDDACVATTLRNTVDRQPERFCSSARSVGDATAVAAYYGPRSGEPGFPPPAQPIHLK